LNSGEKISVGVKEVKIRTRTIKIITGADFFLMENQIPIPTKQIIKVGDSALWLKITIQMRQRQNNKICRQIGE
jgi:hypothetical protein